MNTKRIRIKELDLNQIPPCTGGEDEHGSKIVVIGKPGSGKSYLIRDIIYSKKHIFPVAKVISGTEDSNKFFGKMFTDITIHEKLEVSLIQEFIKRQKIAKKYIPECPWAFLILDDCMDDTSLFRNQVFQNLMKNGRHWKQDSIIGMQYALDIFPALRICIDGTFIFREANPKFRKIIFENYAGVIGDYKLFCKIMDELVSDNVALYIDNRTQSNNIEDCVYWYKARRIDDDFKFGCLDYWLFHKERYDEQHKDTF